MVSPILVALDFPDAGEARAMALRLAPHVAGFKVGLGLMMAAGPQVIEVIAELGLPVFADAKLHDIPNTVAGATRALSSHGARWITVHAGGGPEMIRSAVEAATGNGTTGILVVTVLTSLDDTDLADLGVGRGAADQVAMMAALAARCDAEGVVCPSGAVARAREAAPGLTVVVPGLREPGGDSHDQKQVATPVEALAAGADYLVIGRAITRADDPVAAAAALAPA